MIIRRGTTPYITAEIIDDVDISQIKTAWLTIAQNDEIVLDKITSDLVINENNIALRLSQEDTLSLAAGVMTYIQLRLLTDTDIAYASQQDYIAVEDVSKDGVIS